MCVCVCMYSGVGLSAELQVGISGNAELAAVCTGVLVVLTCAVRLRVEEAALTQDLTAVHTPKPYVQEVVKAYKVM